MLAAERVENERLRKIIRELQRHRFGRRAESLPLDQLQLGLEEAEQAEAADEAVTEATAASLRAVRVAKRRANRGALPAHLPRVRDRGGHRGRQLPVLLGPAAPHRRGRVRAPGRGAGAVPGAGDAPAEIRLPGLHGRRGPGSRAGAADRGRAAHRRHRGAGARVEIRRPPSAVPAGADLRSPGREPGPLHPGRLGGARRAAARARARAPARSPEDVDEALRRRDHGAGARPRAWPHEDRAALGLCARRPALGRRRPAGGGLRLRARSQGRAAHGPPRRLHRRAAGGRLRGLPCPDEGRPGEARLLLGPCSERVHRPGRQGRVADRRRGAHSASRRCTGSRARLPGCRRRRVARRDRSGAGRC